MGQNKITQRLRIPQSAAMAEHQPTMRAKHRDMVRNRFRIRRADTDIDDGDAFIIITPQVIGGHLRELKFRIRFVIFRVRDQANAWTTKAIALIGFYDLFGVFNELIYIALVIGENHEFLEM